MEISAGQGLVLILRPLVVLKPLDKQLLPPQPAAEQEGEVEQLLARELKTQGLWSMLEPKELI